MTEHLHYCLMQSMGHSDAAKRMADTYNLHRIGLGIGAVGKWFAARLSDGTTDDVLYDSKSDCVRHQHHDELMFTYVKIAPSSMNVCDAEILLRTARTLHEKGIRIADPDHKHGGMDVIKRSMVEDQFAQLRGINTNLILPEGY
jgi:hypothetical protein